MAECGIPDCTNKPVKGYTLCKEHNERVMATKSSALTEVTGLVQVPEDE